jgi:hypothetical protein
VLFLVGENDVVYDVSAWQAVARQVASEIKTEVFPDRGHPEGHKSPSS